IQRNTRIGQVNRIIYFNHDDTTRVSIGRIKIYMFHHLEEVLPTEYIPIHKRVFEKIEPSFDTRQNDIDNVVQLIASDQKISQRIEADDSLEKGKNRAHNGNYRATVICYDERGNKIGEVIHNSISYELLMDMNDDDDS